MESDKIQEVRKAKNVPNNCMLISDQYEINKILKDIGFDHNPESIIQEDSFSSLFINTDMGDYTEIWGIHTSVVYDNSKAYRIY
jgi:RAB protein geranylgeranyltransferase component A